ncbi:MAG: anhydro-N-acetylmuramic acid kinase, partial [Flavobacteriales bacterium]|nr:anhydro-N-acetylmuramic acid kinase [Flavobacteriales bacterium]
ENGKLARSGSVDQQLLGRLNALAVYQDKNRPSFSREWVEQFFQPIIEKFDNSPKDVLRTITEHSAMQISKNLNQSIKAGNAFVTGGGAKNKFLIERIRALSDAEIIIPDEKLIDYKEALIFAFLGVLRSNRMINVLRSVTGAKEDSSSGTLHFTTPPKD